MSRQLRFMLARRYVLKRLVFVRTWSLYALIVFIDMTMFLLSVG